MEEFVRQGIDVRILHEVTAVDLDNRLVTVQRVGEGTVVQEPFDHLLLATGNRPLVPDLPGIDASGVFGVGTLAEGERLSRFLETQHVRRAVVVGAGYVGLEMAEALHRRGLAVTLVGRSREVMSTLDPEMGTKVSEAVRRAGIELRLGEEMVGLETSGADEAHRVTAVVTTEGVIPADVVVLGLGVRPRSELGQAAGLKLGARGSIKVDSRMRTSAEGVWAAGDCAESFHLVSRRPVWASLATVANKTGRVAGANIAGHEQSFPGILGTAITKIEHTEIARTGLQARDLPSLGIDYAAVQIDSITRSRYYPGVAPMSVRLLGEKGTGRLLGGQIVGGEGSAKRIDTVVTALQAGMTLDQVVDLDLSYAPPFAPVWEPVLVAARELMKLL